MLDSKEDQDLDPKLTKKEEGSGSSIWYIFNLCLGVSGKIKTIYCTMKLPAGLVK
jgi:hypothetical protein